MRKGEQAVVVCTSEKGVFFGYTKDPDAEQIKLRAARNAYYFKTTTGILELGETGPRAGSKIGARADISSLRNITAVISCTKEAVETWEKAKWG